jgi:hypothetical protein
MNSSRLLRTESAWSRQSFKYTRVVGEMKDGATDDCICELGFRGEEGTGTFEPLFPLAEAIAAA